jgi:hypothetical protein
MLENWVFTFFVANNRHRVCKFLADCIEDGLFSEFPHAGYVIGLVFGDLLIDSTVSIADVEKAVEEGKFGKISESARIFASIVVRMRDHIVGETKTASFFKGFAWKSLWEGGVAEEDSYNEWVAKYSLHFVIMPVKQAVPSIGEIEDPLVAESKEVSGCDKRDSKVSEDDGSVSTSSLVGFGDDLTVVVDGIVEVEIAAGDATDGDTSSVKMRKTNKKTKKNKRKHGGQNRKK